MTDRLSSNDSYFVVEAIMSKNRFRYFKDHICFGNPQKITQLSETDRFTAVKYSIQRDLGNLQLKYFKACCYMGISCN